MAEDQDPAKLSAQQSSLFGPEAGGAERRPRFSLVEIATPTGDTTLGACALPYQEYLRRTDHSKNTITCFLSDLRMLTTFLGASLPTRDLTQARLGSWLEHLRHGGETHPAPKTMARRITFLKNFFGWLCEIGALERNPAERIALSRPSPPLPELLYEDEVARLENAAALDVRCDTLVTLVLSTGLKKEEVMGLSINHVDLSDPERPAIEVRFPGQAKRRRERRMELPAKWTELYQRYLQRYQPNDRVFDCTDRNLNYVLKRATNRAKLEKRVTLQLLRDIYAVRQLRAGVSLDTLRERLGLSEEAWYETAEKYRKLAIPV